MSDIVERLRGKPVRHDYLPEADRQEAADEIERLRKMVNWKDGLSVVTHNIPDSEAVAEKQKQVDYWGQRCERLEADNARLRAALHEAEDQLAPRLLNDRRD